MSKRCRARAICACLSRISVSLVFGLNLPQKDWEGRLALVDLSRRASTRKDETYVGEKKMRQRLRWREEHDGEEKTYSSRGIISERDTMKTRGDGGDVIIATTYLGQSIFIFI